MGLGIRVEEDVIDRGECLDPKGSVKLLPEIGIAGEEGIGGDFGEEGLQQIRRPDVGQCVEGHDEGVHAGVAGAGTLS